jgi:hypothetical protein
MNKQSVSSDGVKEVGAFNLKGAIMLKGKWMRLWWFNVKGGCHGGTCCC